MVDASGVGLGDGMKDGHRLVQPEALYPGSLLIDQSTRGASVIASHFLILPALPFLSGEKGAGDELGILLAGIVKRTHRSQQAAEIVVVLPRVVSGFHNPPSRF